MPEVLKLQREKGYFGSQFWRFQSRIKWPHCFEHLAHYSGSGTDQTIQVMNQKAKRKGRDPGSTVLLRSTPKDLRIIH
jgi:hypothetical protein